MLGPADHSTKRICCQPRLLPLSLRLERGQVDLVFKIDCSIPALPNSCLLLSFWRAQVTAAGFLAYMMDMSPLLPRDTEFLKLLTDAFGVDAHIERSALVKPGSVEDLLRTGRGAHGIPEYTAGELI